MPSETDRAAASYPGLYLIVSLASDPPEVALFRLDADVPGNFVQLRFVAVR
jgi:hypothetical protein